MTGEGLLLIPYSLDRIHACSFSCWEVSEADTDESTYDEADGDTPTRNACREMEQERGKSGDGFSEDYADKSSRHRYYYRLNEELITDVNTTGTN